MRKSVTKIAAVMALTLIVAGSSSNVAYAHHGCSHKALVQPAHYAQTYCYGGSGHHRKHHH